MAAKLAWTLSPRLSFSHDIPQPSLLPESAPALPPSPHSVDSDFDFSSSFHTSIQEPSSAEELFSDGKILPLPIKTPVPVPSPGARGHAKNDKPNRRTNTESYNDSTASKPTAVRRSGSVGDGGRRRIINLCSFRRSKSAGYVNNNDSNNNKSLLISHKRSNGSKGTTYYYSGAKRWSEGSGVRVSPVLNLPASCMRREGSSNNNSSSNILEYLLCKCSIKGMETETETETREVSCSP